MSGFLSSFVEFRSTDLGEKLKMSQSMIDEGGYLVFPIDPTNTNLEENVETSFPVNFRWIS